MGQEAQAQQTPAEVAQHTNGALTSTESTRDPHHVFWDGIKNADAIAIAGLRLACMEGKVSELNEKSTVNTPEESKYCKAILDQEFSDGKLLVRVWDRDKYFAAQNQAAQGYTTYQHPQTKESESITPAIALDLGYVTGFNRPNPETPYAAGISDEQLDGFAPNCYNLDIAKAVALKEQDPTINRCYLVGARYGEDAANRADTTPLNLPTPITPPTDATPQKTRD